MYACVKSCMCVCVPLLLLLLLTPPSLAVTLSSPLPCAARNRFPLHAKRNIYGCSRVCVNMPCAAASAVQFESFSFAVSYLFRFVPLLFFACRFFFAMCVRVSIFYLAADRVRSQSLIMSLTVFLFLWGKKYTKERTHHTTMCARAAQILSHFVQLRILVCRTPLCSAMYGEWWNGHGWSRGHLQRVKSAQFSSCNSEKNTQNNTK